MTPEFRKWAHPTDPTEDTIASRRLAVALLEWACRNKAVETTDERYKRVIEKRKYEPPSSSCGDCAHWLLFRLGVRLTWVNRDENGGWIPGKNVSRLCWAPSPAVPARKTDVYEPGDIIVIWSRPSTKDQRGDEHVVCVIDHDPKTQTLQTAEYGQPGGALRTHVLISQNGGLYIKNRRIQRVLRLQEVLSFARRMGKLVGADEPVPNEQET